MTETRIDSHFHTWDLSVRDQPWTEPLPPLRRSFPISEFTRQLLQEGFGGAIAVQTVPSTAETLELLVLAASEPIVQGVVGWVDLTAGSVPDDLAGLRAAPGGRKLVGVRHLVQDEPDDRWLCRAEVGRGLRALADAGLVFDLLVRPRQLPAAVEVAQSMPEIRFVLDHCGKPRVSDPPSAEWIEHMLELSRLPNVVVKLSGLVTEATDFVWAVSTLRPYVDLLLTYYGPERVMFGSDWPVCTLASSYAEVVETAHQLTNALSPAEAASVFGRVAARWYQL